MQLQSCSDHGPTLHLKETRVLNQRALIQEQTSGLCLKNDEKMIDESARKVSNVQVQNSQVIHQAAC